MTQHPPIRDTIRENYTILTATERRLAQILLDDSMVAGLQSITKLAALADMSTPTIIRMARKLGFEGYTDMQEIIRRDVEDRIKKPLNKLEDWEESLESDHILSRFAKVATHNFNLTLNNLDVDAFDQVSDMLADISSNLFIVGGRITRSNADYLFNHLQIVRPRVTLLAQSPNVWPQAILDMNEHSILLVFDIRRYERELENLARLAAERGARVILFTDIWSSPIASIANIEFRAAVEAPSSWDSTLALNLILEALIASVQMRSSEESVKRINALEKVLSKSTLFKG